MAQHVYGRQSRSPEIAASHRLAVRTLPCRALSAVPYDSLSPRRSGESRQNDAPSRHARGEKRRNPIGRRTRELPSPSGTSSPPTTRSHRSPRRLPSARHVASRPRIRWTPVVLRRDGRPSWPRPRMASHLPPHPSTATAPPACATFANTSTTSANTRRGRFPRPIPLSPDDPRAPSRNDRSLRDLRGAVKLSRPRDGNAPSPASVTDACWRSERERSAGRSGTTSTGGPTSTSGPISPLAPRRRGGRRTASGRTGTGTARSSRR